MCFSFCFSRSSLPVSPVINSRTIRVEPKAENFLQLPDSSGVILGERQVTIQSSIPERLVNTPSDLAENNALRLQNQALRIADLEKQLVLNGERERQAIASLEAKIERNLKSSHENNIVFSYTNHEVRNIIQSLLGIMEGYKYNESTSSPHLDKAWSSIHYLAKELSPLLNTGLDLAKIFNNKMELERKKFSFNELKNTVIAQFACRNKGGVEFKFIASPSIPPYLVGDPHRLNQILTNLITNAFKFTEKGQVTVTIEVISKKQGDVTLNFAVEDTGKGIPRDIIEELGQPFRQADASVARQSGGTGLGLYISKLLINLMNANPPDEGAEKAIKIESTLNKGSIFSFNAQFKYVNIPIMSIQVPMSPLSDCRILLADDDEISLKLMKKKLESHGAQVSTATNGQEVLGLVGSQGYDAILLDMRMPVMDGFETAKKLEQLRQTSRHIIPIPIPCSGNASPQDQIDYEAAGMNRYLSKPFTINEAVAAVLVSKTEVMKQKLD